MASSAAYASRVCGGTKVFAAVVNPCTFWQKSRNKCMMVIFSVNSLRKDRKPLTVTLGIEMLGFKWIRSFSSRKNFVVAGRTNIQQTSRNRQYSDTVEICSALMKLLEARANCWFQYSQKLADWYLLFTGHVTSGLFHQSACTLSFSQVVACSLSNFTKFSVLFGGSNLETIETGFGGRAGFEGLLNCDGPTPTAPSSSDSSSDSVQS